MNIPSIPLWFVAGIAAIWAGTVLWKLFGERALTRSRDAGKLERLTGSGEQTMETRKGLAEELNQAGLSLAVGSFNGLRVGMSTAKGLAFALSIPLVGISTLELEAYPYAATGLPVCPMLSAGRGEIAAALFQSTRGRWRRLVDEHITTIEKAMKQIMDLRGKQETNDNQLVRWIMNKEDHANEIQHIVAQYFMTQRLKPDSKDYSKKLALLHKMLVRAMKCKQTTDFSHTKALRSLVHDFGELYFGKAHNSEKARNNLRRRTRDFC